MAAFTKAFFGVPDGEIYPVEYQPGEECPPELEAGAVALGALVSPGDGADIDDLSAAQLRQRLDDKKIDYKSNASKAELIALLKAAEA